ncbi:MAG: DUF4912 domain-containing protein [Deltaproteobacteria bacterium]
MNPDYLITKDSFSGRNIKDQIWIMPKDPYILYVYFEVSPETHSSFESVFGYYLWESSHLVLKVFNLSNNTYKYLKTEPDSNGIYLKLDKPNNLIRIEIGKMISNEFYIPFAGSNVVCMPNNNIINEDNIHFENVLESKSIGKNVNTDLIYEKFKFNEVSHYLAPSSVDMFMNMEKINKN